MNNWNDLVIFLQIARTGSMTAAARELRLDHSTVSRRLAALETELAVRLFDRAGRRLAMTEGGLRLADAAAKMEAIYLGEAAGLAQNTDRLAGRVRIGAPEGLGVGCLADFVAATAATYPDLELELVALPRDYSLARREADIAVTLDRPTSGAASTCRLTDYKLLLYGIEAYLHRHGAPRNRADLGMYVMCGYIPELLHTRELDYATIVGNWKIRLRSTSILAQLEMICGGQAIGILPCFLARQRPELIPLLPNEIWLQRSYWVSIHDDLKQVQKHRVVLQALLDHMRSQRASFMCEHEG
ncbi:LysR family transcriptional regulator [Bosea sp. 2KB_26]|uniref:LysR family transcriptional regulator n=1 Tax=Bosea sp. 2KB_26 TaxID=3237475 RepID=UPI003F8F1BBE